MADPTELTLTDLAAAFRRAELSPVEALDAYEAKLEPGPVYRLLTLERAREQARRAEAMFRAGVDAGPLQGVPIALKDMMDTAGDVTAAGSRVLAENAPAVDDCPAAARLDAAGAVFLGKTNMTELAFSGIGINPHFGTPGNAVDPSRVPGGSSSGAAVAVARGLACAAVGSDTGGSVRIPAAFNGLVGLKTSDGRIPTDGCAPLSTTLDTLGPLARTVDDAWALFQALIAAPPRPLEAWSGPLKLWAPPTVLHDDLEPAVADAFEALLVRLEAAGHAVERRPLPALAEIAERVARLGSFASHEAYALYGDLIEERGAEMDPRVTRRVLQYRDRPARDYLHLVYARRDLRRRVWDEAGACHALLAPTVAIQPPTIEALTADDAYFRANALALRNTMLFNFLAGPAATVPVARSPEGLPLGAMVATAPGRDGLALRLAAALARG